MGAGRGPTLNKLYVSYLCHRNSRYGFVRLFGAGNHLVVFWLVLLTWEISWSGPAYAQIESVAWPRPFFLDGKCLRLTQPGNVALVFLQVDKLF